MLICSFLRDNVRNSLLDMQRNFQQKLLTSLFALVPLLGHNSGNKLKHENKHTDSVKSDFWILRPALAELKKCTFAQMEAQNVHMVRQRCRKPDDNTDAVICDRVLPAFSSHNTHIMDCRVSYLVPLMPTTHVSSKVFFRHEIRNIASSSVGFQTLFCSSQLCSDKYCTSGNISVIYMRLDTTQSDLKHMMMK